jgi:uncharacterized protein (TIGR02117 family)
MQLRLYLRPIWWLTFLLIGAIAVYLLAAWIGSSLPANADAIAPRDGVPIWVETNGIHTGLIVPMANEHADFTAFASPDHARAAPANATHMLVGWGHAGVYRETPEWRDLRAGDALSAIFGSDETVLHITFLTEPRSANALQRRVVISPAAYRRLAARITARFAPDATHQPAYGNNDVFYDSVGRYSALATCNSWTGDLLREAGLPMGRWTPFAGGVMKWLPQRPG